MARIELKEQYPEDDILIIPTKEKDYEIPLVITSDVGDMIIDNIDVIQVVLPGSGGFIPKFNKEILDLARRLLAEMGKSVYPEMDYEFIRKNLSLPRLIISIYSIIRPVYDFLIASGFVNSITPDDKVD
jgi:hypothetical protein